LILGMAADARPQRGVADEVIENVNRNGGGR
jgi:hypothetical protein